jgi:uncharacterized protein YhbP (UPF0306 family)
MESPGIKEFSLQLANCQLTKLEADTEHYYYINGNYAVSVTWIEDIAAPFPEGLRQWLRMTDADESQERMIMTRDRGTKLHHALENLVAGMELYLEDYPTTYEKDAIVTFIRCIRLLKPTELKTELIVADTKLMVGGTLDLAGVADKRILDILTKPTYQLKLEGDNFELIKPLEGKKKLVRFVIDYKFTGRSSYNHKVQATKYLSMYNASYAPQKASQAYIWRYSPKHKFGFDFQDASIHLGSKITKKSFNRIFETAIEYLGGYPKPPLIKVFPERVKLFNKKEK